MPNDETTIEQERAMNLAQNQSAGQRAEKSAGAQSGQKHFINSGEAALLLAFTGLIELIQWAVDLLNIAFGIGIIINAVITGLVFGILAIWMLDKVAKGAPKKWYKALWYGAGGGILPVIPGFLGAIIYLLIQDRNIPIKKFK